jgi:carbonic anhydrase
MDYRLMGHITTYMDGRGLGKKYDHVALAGASLAALTEDYPAWSRTFWEHLDIAIKLHDINTVIVMDHYDCGAYKTILGAEHTNDPQVEKETHAGRLRDLRARIGGRHPELKVETLLMALDGKVEVIE